MVPGIDPKVDIAFKKVFGSEAFQDLTVSLINAVLAPPPDRAVVSVQLLNPYNERMTLDDKLSILDIKARDQQGRLFHLEMQMSARSPMAPRLLYYWSKVYSQQLVVAGKYTELRPAISICFVNNRISADWPNYVTRFQLLDQSGKHCLTGDQEIVIVELPKFRKPLERLRKPLDFWLYLLKNGETLDADSPPEPLNRPEQRRALEVLKMLSQSELEREQYESRVRAQMDWDTLEELKRIAESERDAALEKLAQSHAETEQVQAESKQIQAESKQIQAENKQFRIESNQLRSERDSAMQRIEALSAACEQTDQRLAEANRIAKIGLARSIRSSLRLLGRPAPTLETLMRKEMEQLRQEAEQLETEVSRKFDRD
jgi:predicted transposase/invertase (TIGR01784 family)